MPEDSKHRLEPLEGWLNEAYQAGRASLWNDNLTKFQVQEVPNTGSDSMWVAWVGQPVHLGMSARTAAVVTDFHAEPDRVRTGAERTEVAGAMSAIATHMDRSGSSDPDEHRKHLRTLLEPLGLQPDLADDLLARATGSAPNALSGVAPAGRATRKPGTETAATGSTPATVAHTAGAKPRRDAGGPAR